MKLSNSMNADNSTNPANSAAIQQHAITRTGVKFLVLLSLWLIAFIPVYPSLVWTWLNHSDNSHGILVPLVSLYFVWQKKKRAKVNQKSEFYFRTDIFFGQHGGLSD